MPQGQPHQAPYGAPGYPGGAPQQGYPGGYPPPGHPPQAPYGMPGKPQKKRSEMLLANWFLGGFGVHRMMAGYSNWWLMPLTCFGVFGIWPLVDFFRTLHGSFTMADGRPLLMGDGSPCMPPQGSDKVAFAAEVLGLISLPSAILLLNPAVKVNPAAMVWGGLAVALAMFAKSKVSAIGGARVKLGATLGGIGFLLGLLFYAYRIGGE